jgi:integrase/recombinase XerC
LARSTLRGYQLRLKVVSEYACDRRYPWVVICELEFGRGPGRLFEENLVAHLDEFEGDPRRRPLTVDELEAFFAACEQRIELSHRTGRKGALQPWRDQVLFKVKFGWGLRRAGVAMLGVVDFRPHAKLPRVRRVRAAACAVGKAKRGGGPQRRTVLTVFDWAPAVIEQYLTEIRPAFGRPDHPRSWGGRRSSSRIRSGTATPRRPRSTCRSAMTSRTDSCAPRSTIRSCRSGGADGG